MLLTHASQGQGHRSLAAQVLLGSPKHCLTVNTNHTLRSDMDTRFPSGETVFEYAVDARNRSWQHWDARLSSTGFKPRSDVPLHRLLVPTVDTARNTAVAGALVRAGAHTLLIGGVGVGKTMTLSALLDALPSTTFAHMTLNFSAQTTSNSLQA